MGRVYAFKNLHLGKVCLFDERCSSLVVVVLVEGGVWCVVGGGAWWWWVVVTPISTMEMKRALPCE